MGGEFTYQPKWDPIGFDPQPVVSGNPSLVAWIGLRVNGKAVPSHQTTNPIQGEADCLRQCFQYLNERCNLTYNNQCKKAVFKAAKKRNIGPLYCEGAHFGEPENREGTPPDLDLGWVTEIFQTPCAASLWALAQ